MVPAHSAWIGRTLRSLLVKTVCSSRHLRPLRSLRSPSGTLLLGNLWAWTLQYTRGAQNSFVDVSCFLQAVDFSIRFPANFRWPRIGTPLGRAIGTAGVSGRIAWTHRAFGQDLTVGFGGSCKAEFRLGRNVNGWASTFDVLVPLGRCFDLSGAFYRGAAVAGLGGGIGQSILTSGPFTDPATMIKGLDSMGGWVQLKFKPKTIRNQRCLRPGQSFCG